jgi:hypothetical protein
MEVFLPFFCFPCVGYFFYLNCSAGSGETEWSYAVGHAKRRQDGYALFDPHYTYPIMLVTDLGPNRPISNYFGI